MVANVHTAAVKPMPLGQTISTENVLYRSWVPSSRGSCPTIRVSCDFTARPMWRQGVAPRASILGTHARILIIDVPATFGCAWAAAEVDKIGYDEMRRA